MTNAIDAELLRSVVITFRDALVANKAVINALNVYPVPDGDTGTNMSLTLESVVEDLPDPGAGMADVCKAISHGSLMGCLLYTSPSPRDATLSRMPSSA